MVKVRSCAHCGTSFSPRSRASRFCSRVCANTSRARSRPTDDELRRLYVANRMSGPALAALCGVSTPTVMRWLHDAGVAVRSLSDARPETLVAKRRVPRDRDLLYQLYVTDGESTPMIAARFGVHSFTVRRVLRELEIPIRRGRSEADRRRLAQTVERGALRNLSKYEARLLDALRRCGLCPTPQMALGKYNIDLAFTAEKLAVEVDGGNWHSSARKVAQDRAKERYLADRGWRVLRIGTTRKDWVRRAITAVRAELDA